jgi:MFS family permease
MRRPAASQAAPPWQRARRRARYAAAMIATAPIAPQEAEPRERWRMLALVSTAELLGMSLWFVAAALTPQLRARWGLDAGQAGTLTAAVQLGFVAGTAASALLNLADIVPSRLLFATCAVLAAAANAALLAPIGFAAALGSRFLVGMFLAGVYPPSMKMIATWFRRARGLAIGTVVGALTVGKATPYFLHALGGASVVPVTTFASSIAIVAALLVAAGFREGPFAFPRRAFSWSLVGTVVHDRATRLAIAGYLGHMWELYAMWTWLPAFLAASLAARGAAHPGEADLLAFAAIAAGGLGCVWGGMAAARSGYARVVTWAMAASGTCALAIGALFGGPWWAVGGLACVWGFFVVADSAQFSALVTEVAPAHAVGTALTLQTSIGFLLTLATIALVPRLAEAAGWRWAFPVLALGPAFGIVAIAGLRGATART